MKISKKIPTLPPFPQGYINSLSESELDELKVLLYILTKEGETDTSELVEALSIEETDVISAVSFWRGAGMISVGGRAKGNTGVRREAAKKEESEQHKEEAARLPGSVRDTDNRTYTGEELARIINENGELASLIEYAQQRLGKVFSPSETASLVSLADYVLLTPPMIMLIIEYCAENGKKSMRYVERTAISIYDEGIHDYEALVAYFDKKKAAKSNEGIVRRIIGAGERSFTSREKEHIARWFGEFRSGEELITLAYEKTIANISKPSIPYMSKLLELWHGKGLKCARDVENERNAAQNSENRGTIDLDSFDEAARNNDGDASNEALDLDDFFEN